MKDKTRIHELDAIKDWPLLGCKRYRGAVIWKNFKDGTYNIWRYKNLSAEQVDRKIDNVVSKRDNMVLVEKDEELYWINEKHLKQTALF